VVSRLVVDSHVARHVQSRLSLHSSGKSQERHLLDRGFSQLAGVDVRFS
jgi:hypothetical protein